MKSLRDLGSFDADNGQSASFLDDGNLAHRLAPCLRELLLGLGRWALKVVSLRIIHLTGFCIWLHGCEKFLRAQRVQFSA
jgi:hypothetical protein